MSTYNLGGGGPPKILLDNGTVIPLPVPNGSGRKGLEKYRFPSDILNSFRSEGNLDIEVGRKYKFASSLHWLYASKIVLHNLFKCAAERSFMFWPHDDNDDVKHRCRLTGEIDYEYFEGSLNHPAGYSIKIELAGTEYIDAPFEGALETAAGYGTDWGENAQNQSP